MKLLIAIVAILVGVSVGALWSPRAASILYAQADQRAGRWVFYPKAGAWDASSGHLLDTATGDLSIVMIDLDNSGLVLGRIPRVAMKASAAK